MAKYLSSVVNFWLDGYDLTLDTTEVSIGSMAREVPATTIGQTAERVVSGVFGGEFSHSGIFDGTAGQINTAGAALIGATPVATMAVSNVAGKRALSGLILETSFKTPTPLGGLVMATVTGTTDNKVEASALVIQEKVTKTGTFNSTSVDNAAASAAGGVGFLHIFAADGTADITIHESSDDAVGDPFATVLTFAQFSALGSQRVAITGGIERYIRVGIILGTATSVTYAVTFARL